MGDEKTRPLGLCGVRLVTPSGSPHYRDEIQPVNEKAGVTSEVSDHEKNDINKTIKTTMTGFAPEKMAGSSFSRSAVRAFAPPGWKRPRSLRATTKKPPTALGLKEYGQKRELKTTTDPGTGVFTALF